MKDKLTIGLLLDDTLDRLDGVQQAVVTIGQELSRKGHDVHYIVPITERTDLPNIHSVGNFINLKFNGNSVRTPLPASRKKIKKLFSEVDFDVLHVQMPFSPFLSAEVLRLAPDNVKKIGTFHILPYNMAANYGTKMLGIIMQKTIKSLDVALAVSEPAKNFMEEAFNVAGTVLPNPVDYKFYHSFSKKSQTKKQVVFVGRFEERKGVLELINAYSTLTKNRLNETKLIMCGRGPLLENAKELSKNLQLNIEFPGFVTEKEKAQYLADADIAVFPSKSGESFGIVLIEAMSAGSGITIGGNNPGYNSVLSHWSETIFDPTNSKQFGKLLENLLTNEKKLQKIGAEQHKLVKQYDTTVVVDKLLHYYKS